MNLSKAEMTVIHTMEEITKEITTSPTIREQLPGFQFELRRVKDSHLCLTAADRERHCQISASIVGLHELADPLTLIDFSTRVRVFVASVIGFSTTTYWYWHQPKVAA